MLTSFRIRAAQSFSACLFLTICIAAPVSAKSALTDTKGLLQYVPDDTPYIFASGAPLPDDFMDRIEPRVNEMLKAYQVFFRDIFHSALAKNSGGMSIEEIQRTTAVVDEIVNLLSIEGMRSAGVERNGGLVIFGHGLLPVLRMELGDTDKFGAVIKRMESAAGDSMQTAKLDGVTYRYIGDDEARVIIGVFEGNAVFALAPAELDESQLKALVGLTPIKNNIARSGKLLDIVKKYNFSEYYVGYVDSLQIASAFLDKPSGMNAALFAGAGYDSAVVSEVCKEEIRDVVGIAPRMVVGYGDVSADAVNGSLIIEMREDLAAGLSTLAALVPGLGTDPGGLVSFGMSFSVPALYAFAEARLDAMEEDPFACEHFAELQAGVAKGRESLAQPLPPFITGLRGFNVIVDNLGDYDVSSGQPPQDVDASVVLSMDDAQAVFMMGAMMSPDLAAVELQPDGVAVPLALPQLQAIAKSAYAAMKETALAVSMGSGARTRVTSVLNADAVEPPPIMSASMDASKYYELIAQSLMAEQDDDNDENPLSVSARIALRDAMLKIGEMYDRMAFNVHFTQHGVELETNITMSE